ncbi:hypothetical protein Ae168Ps1_5240c [Pseudonocardia sp. Ae168_Ps1]|nr:hypothetical protein Ae168Ps1_5240c [Pseudonocardia sp. Ae168_Ps1]OLL83054.1 hypothetical protein Ae263Ps1_0109 [Pseudonocardia sp. Ae263_Ps1]OLL90907.1 hypothetical protein Ae356Ps1_0804c [Pseudonocardia sp. Ae356_Ps1]
MVPRGRPRVPHAVPWSGAREVHTTKRLHEQSFVIMR